MVSKDGKEEKSDSLSAAAISEAVGSIIPLKKTRTAIDSLIAVPFEVWRDQLSAKMRGNVEKHVDAVKTKRTKQKKKTTIDHTSLKIAESLAEWGTAASQIDESEKEFSAMWRGLLGAILDEEDPEDLIKIVKTTPSSDLRMFLDYGQSPMRLLFHSSSALDRLKANGLIEGVITREIFFIVLILVGAIVLYLVQMLPRSLDSVDQLLLKSVLVSVIALVPLAISWIWQKPTRQGQSLLKLYREYSEQRD